MSIHDITSRDLTEVEDGEYLAPVKRSEVLGRDIYGPMARVLFVGLTGITLNDGTRWTRTGTPFHSGGTRNPKQLVKVLDRTAYELFLLKQDTETPSVLSTSRADAVLELTRIVANPENLRRVPYARIMKALELLKDES